MILSVGPISSRYSFTLLFPPPQCHTFGHINFYPTTIGAIKILYYFTKWVPLDCRYLNWIDFHLKRKITLTRSLYFYSLLQCQAIKHLGFRRGSYKCVCRKGFYYPDTSLPQHTRHFNGSTLEEEYEKLMLVSTFAVNIYIFDHLGTFIWLVFSIFFICEPFIFHAWLSITIHRT